MSADKKDPPKDRISRRRFFGHVADAIVNIGGGALVADAVVTHQINAPQRILDDLKKDDVFPKRIFEERPATVSDDIFYYDFKSDPNMPPQKLSWGVKAFGVAKAKSPDGFHKFEKQMEAMPKSGKIPTENPLAPATISPGMYGDSVTILRVNQPNIILDLVKDQDDKDSRIVILDGIKNSAEPLFFGKAGMLNSVFVYPKNPEKTTLTVKLKPALFSERKTAFFKERTIEYSGVTFSGQNTIFDLSDINLIENHKTSVLSSFNATIGRQFGAEPTEQSSKKAIAYNFSKEQIQLLGAKRFAQWIERNILPYNLTNTTEQVKIGDTSLEPLILPPTPAFAPFPKAMKAIADWLGKIAPEMGFTQQDIAEIQRCATIGNSFSDPARER